MRARTRRLARHRVRHALECHIVDGRLPLRHVTDGALHLVQLSRGATRLSPVQLQVRLQSAQQTRRQMFTRAHTQPAGGSSDK